MLDGVVLLEMALWGRMGRWVLVTKDGVLFSTGKVLRPGKISRLKQRIVDG